jgi:hypothetical protein
MKLEELFRLTQEAQTAAWRMRQSVVDGDRASFTEYSQWLRMVCVDLSNFTGEPFSVIEARYREQAENA